MRTIFFRLGPEDDVGFDGHYSPPAPGTVLPAGNIFTPIRNSHLELMNGPRGHFVHHPGQYHGFRFYPGDECRMVRFGHVYQEMLIYTAGVCVEHPVFSDASTETSAA